MGPKKTFSAVCIILLALVVPDFATVAADDASKIYAEVCSGCHTPKKQPLDKVRLTRDGWNEAIERMVSYGAEIPKGKLPELLDFLVKPHGPTGSADEVRK
ncbi:MAG: hypothetical protein NTY41_08400 [Proteobacteria bacterium]|nr:hypothetical protein [Pseudomonadota bacterium]